MEDSYETYQVWKEELIIKPLLKSDEDKAAAKKIMDHPLSVSHNS